MSNRIVRINELVRREISEILRRRHAAESVAITVTEVRIAPDLRDGRVFVAILGEESAEGERFRWLKRHASDIRKELARRIVLKQFPRLTYVLDTSGPRAARVISVMDEIERSSAPSDGDILS